MKLGLGESYDRVSIVSQKTRAYLDLTKPASSVGVAGLYLLGSLFYFEYTGSPTDLTTAIYVSVTILFAHGASQALNMAEDAHIDKETEHKKNRPIPSGIVSEDEARTLAWFMMAFAMGRAYLVSASFGILVTILCLMGVFYNLSPIRAKERAFSIPWQAASRGLLAFPTIWAAYGNPFEITPWVLGLFLFLYVFGFQNSADISDKKVDEQFGVKTFVVMYGVQGVATIAAGCVFLMVAVIVGSISMGVLPDRLIWILGVVPFCVIMVLYMALKPNQISNYTGNHPAWLHFYIGMVLTIAIPLVVEVL